MSATKTRTIPGPVIGGQSDDDAVFLCLDDVEVRFEDGTPTVNAKKGWRIRVPRNSDHHHRMRQRPDLFREIGRG